jgi:type IV pilus assembly PilM-like protein
VRTRCAIDIGTRELRLVEAEDELLVRHAEVLLPDGALVDGMPTPEFTTVLRGAVDAAGFKSTRVRVSIPETGTAFRDFGLPAIRPSELSSAVMFEGRRLIPIDAADVYFAWHAARRHGGYAIYLVAARRDMVDGVIAAISAAGLAAERIDLKPLALARGMRVADGLLLDWGAGEATLVVMASNRPRFFRTFQLDAPLDDVEGQLDELVLSLNALVKFIRGAAPDVAIGSSTTLSLGGRFAFLPEGARRAEERFPFKVTLPTTPLPCVADFPWQAHFVGAGLLQQERWRNRLTPSQGGDIRVAT